MLLVRNGVFSGCGRTCMGRERKAEPCKVKIRWEKDLHIQKKIERLFAVRTRFLWFYKRACLTSNPKL